MSTVTAVAYPRVGDNLPNGDYLAEAWSTRMNVLFYEKTYYDQICNTNWEGELKRGADKVWIRTPPHFLIKDYVAGQGLQQQGVTEEKTLLEINKGKYFHYPVRKIDEIQSNLNIRNEFLQGATRDLRVAINKNILGSVYADSANAAVDASAATKDTIHEFWASAKKVLRKQNVELEDGNLYTVINPEAERLFQIGDFKRSDQLGRPNVPSPTITGMLPEKISGAKVFVSNHLAIVTSKAQCLYGHQMAITFAAQMDYMRVMPNPNDAGDLVTGLMVYGFKTVRPEALVVIQTAQ